MSDIPLVNISSFVKVAELSSFSKAARALKVSPPVVSKRVSSLEERLGIRLLHRSTRQVQLTEAGRELFESLGDALGRIDAAVDKLLDERDRVRGELSVIVPTYFAGPDLHQQVIPDFLERYPQCELRLRVVDSPLDRLGEPFDLLIAGRLPERQLADSALIRRRLMRLRGSVYGAPSYLDTAGRPQRPADVLGHRCLNYLTRQWRFVTPAGKVEIIEPRGPISTNSTDTLKALVCRGMGLVYSIPAFFSEELATGAVEEVLEKFTQTSYLEMNLFYPRQAHQPARTKAFIELLQAHYATD